MRILLVEDHMPLAQALSEGLTRASFAVDHATSALQAQQMVELADYDLVLLDLGLPDKDGLTILKDLRANGHAPVVIMTARDQLADRLAGFTPNHLVDPDELSRLHQRYLRSAFGIVRRAHHALASRYQL